MALVCTLKETLSKKGSWAGSPDNGPSYSWTAFTPAANTLLVAIFGANDNAEANLFQTYISSVTGGSLTWTKLIYADSGTNHKARSVIYYAEVGASPASTTVTITFSSASKIGQISASIWECSGYDTSSPLGGKAALANQASNGAVTMTLDATPASDSVVLRHIHRNCDPGGGTFDTDLGTGFTEDGVSNQDSVYVWSQGSQRGGSTSTAVGFDDVQTGSATTTNYETSMAAVEVKAAAGGGGGLSIPVVMNQYRQRVA